MNNLFALIAVNTENKIINIKDKIPPGNVLYYSSPLKLSFTLSP
jgi:hypothetical protein